MKHGCSPNDMLFLSDSRMANASQDTYVFPLRDTTFEGVPCKIPYRYQDMLRAEYGKKALSNTEYHE
jgi:hypothetical protein